jgi:hypothetical protein
VNEPVVEQRPPDAVLRIVNPVLRRVLQSSLGRRVPGLAVLQFTGRRSGRAYRVVAGWYRLDGQEFAVTPARWRANLEGGAPLTVTNRGRPRPGCGRLVTDPVVVTDAVQRLMDRGTSARALGLAVAAGHRLTEADMVKTHKALVRFTPDPE